jgi:hypothetical protein
MNAIIIRALLLPLIWIALQDQQTRTSTASTSGTRGVVSDRAGESPTGAAAPGRTPVYRIDLRVHIGPTTLPLDELRKSLEEMNSIWWSQAGVCFEITSTNDDTRAAEGFDIWFVPEVPDPPGVNGVFKGDHDIWSRDYPDLRPSPNPVTQRAARTSAHELGHGLTLAHYNGYPDSTDSLMSSGNLGWKLNDFQIQAARARARQKANARRKANPDTIPKNCSTPQVE